MWPLWPVKGVFCSTMKSLCRVLSDCDSCAFGTTSNGSDLPGQLIVIAHSLLVKQVPTCHIYVSKTFPFTFSDFIITNSAEFHCLSHHIRKNARVNGSHILAEAGFPQQGKTACQLPHQQGPLTFDEDLIALSPAFQLLCVSSPPLPPRP